MTVPNDTAYDPEVHLNFGDIAVDNPSSPQMMKVTIKQSKMDPFWEKPSQVCAQW